jgi:uncharacterized protein (UPF0332 family)
LSITASDLLDFAECLNSQNPISEALLRTSISRAYYSAYHYCLSWHLTLPAQGSKPVLKTGVHATLSYCLKNPAKETRLANRGIESIQKGVLLKRLHDERVRADYKLDHTISKAHSLRAVEQAKLIFI